MAESQQSPPPSNQLQAQPQDPRLHSQPAPSPPPQPSSSSSPVQQRQQQATDSAQPEQQRPSSASAAASAPAGDNDMAASNAARPDVVMGGTEGEAANDDTQTAPASSATTGQAGTQLAGLSALEAPPGPPPKKETSLREFLGQMDEYAPIIPDAVTAHYLTVAGLPPPGNGPNHTPIHLARLLALATQKFVADIAADAYQYARIRNSSNASNPIANLNVNAGLTAQGQAGGAAAGAGGAAGGGGAGGAGGTGEAGKGKSSTAGLHLGVQRAGFGGGGHGGSQGKTVLTMEDLGMAVAEYGVTVKRGEFYR